MLPVSNILGWLHKMGGEHTCVNLFGVLSRIGFGHALFFVLENDDGPPSTASQVFGMCDDMLECACAAMCRYLSYG